MANGSITKFENLVVIVFLTNSSRNITHAEAIQNAGIIDRLLKELSYLGCYQPEIYWTSDSVPSVWDIVVMVL